MQICETYVWFLLFTLTKILSGLPVLVIGEDKRKKKVLK